MAIVIDKILGKALMHSHVKKVSSDPASGSEFDLILNTTDLGLKIYYAGVWQTLHTLADAGFTFMDGDAYTFMDGDSFNFMNA